ncbi:uncharacterized protein [Ptychodera flava]|uniref:uncharacterized protein n=1 Tax=Ptychodera flava TaxID=63121 RepID=UPI00396A057D
MNPVRQGFYALLLFSVFIITISTVYFSRQASRPLVTAQSVTNSESVERPPKTGLRSSATAANSYGSGWQHGKETLLVYSFLENLNAPCKKNLIEIIKEQEILRRRKESDFMEECGWSNMTDRAWYSMMDFATYEAGDIYKPGSHNRDDRSGSASLHLNDELQRRDVWFKVSPTSIGGHGEKHISQIAVFQLDRLLGLYYTVPARGVNLNVTALLNKPIPDEFNEFLEKLGDLVNDQGFVQGTLNAWIEKPLFRFRYNMPSYRRIPVKILTSNLSDRQRYEMEYRLFLWLSGLRLYDNQHDTLAIDWADYPVVIDSDRAFRESDSKPPSYLYNCRFPKHVIQYLRVTADLSPRCSLGQQLTAALNSDPIRPNRQELTSKHSVNGTNDALTILDASVVSLLQLVDKCIEKFGEKVVLYEDV